MTDTVVSEQEQLRRELLKLCEILQDNAVDGDVTIQELEHETERLDEHEDSGVVVYDEAIELRVEFSRD